MGQRALVTGIDGFTGRYMARTLLSSGFEVHGIAQHNAEIEGATIHSCDLLDGSALTALAGAICPHKVLHLAAISSVDHQNVQAIYDVNIVGSRNLLHALTQVPETPGAILLASSANIYGNRTEGVLTEDSPPEPVNDYAVSKLAMEFVARTFSQLPIIIARPFNYTGVGQSANFLIPKIVDHFRRRAASISLGNIDVSRDYSDVRTVVEAYARLIEAPAAIGKTFNIASGKPYSLQQILSLARDLTGHDIEVVQNPALMRANEVRTLSGSAAGLESVIGSLERPDFRDTLQWMLHS